MPPQILPGSDQPEEKTDKLDRIENAKQFLEASFLLKIGTEVCGSGTGQDVLNKVYSVFSNSLIYQNMIDGAKINGPIDFRLASNMDEILDIDLMACQDETGKPYHAKVRDAYEYLLLQKPSVSVENAESVDKISKAISEPNHYKTDSGADSLDVLRDMMGKDNFAGGCMLNIIKYVKRYKMKNGKEDLLKAMVYLQKLIETEYPAK